MTFFRFSFVETARLDRIEKQLAQILLILTKKLDLSEEDKTVCEAIVEVQHALEHLPHSKQKTTNQKE